MNPTVNKNLKKMTSIERGGMHYIIIRESFGGSAGSWRRKPCAVANFYYESETGLIECFGNYQDMPLDIIAAFCGGTFRAALDLQKTRKFRIIDTFLDNLTEKAIKNLEESAKLYNEIYGFKEDYLWNF